ncbi:helix-turn-helix protein [Caudoviricetes sp.]|nr:helix-turn-helix protein [Caudoviricetes sp.]UOF79105.1 helix-turn-helix protein [Caudoviricetes sp.]
MLGKPLTKREVEYVTLATSDLSFREIGVIAKVTEETVKCALSVVYAKLGVRNRYGMIIHQMKKDNSTMALEAATAEESGADIVQDIIDVAEATILPPGFQQVMTKLQP